jgi:chorismate synthase
VGFRFLTAGQPHGGSLSAVIGGAPAGLVLSRHYIERDRRRRRDVGGSRGGQTAIERDRAGLDALTR